MPTATDLTDTARRALEEVCSGRNLDGIPRVYHPEFVDHVNGLEYRGHDGARRSVALYLELFPDLRFEVEEQVSEGDRVASRWTLQGTHRGRTVELRGIVISRFEDGRDHRRLGRKRHDGAGSPARPAADPAAGREASEAALRSGR
jgi:ketosteroid isomerase-like protein